MGKSKLRRMCPLERYAMSRGVVECLIPALDTNNRRKLAPHEVWVEGPSLKHLRSGVGDGEYLISKTSITVHDLDTYAIKHSFGAGSVFRLAAEQDEVLEEGIEVFEFVHWKRTRVPSKKFEFEVRPDVRCPITKSMLQLLTPTLR